MSISAKELQALLSYNPDTGKLRWLPRCISLFKDERAWKIWNTRYANKEAFTAVVDGTGRRNGAVFGVNYQAHRVCWAVHHGEWPAQTIDHINGDPSDNRLCNLRDVSQEQQNRNLSIKATNTSGHPGVTKHTNANVWISRINLNKRTCHVGSFARYEDAVQARKIAEILAGYHANHGRSKEKQQ
jgi:hypothetical protein